MSDLVVSRWKVQLQADCYVLYYRGKFAGVCVGLYANISLKAQYAERRKEARAAVERFDRLCLHVDDDGHVTRLPARAA